MQHSKRRKSESESNSSSSSSENDINEKPDLKFISQFSECLGAFDLLPKLGYRDMETAIGDHPAFMFWGLYLVESSESKIKMPFCIVDNLDAEAKTFVIKDTRVEKPIVINMGPAPAVFSVAELRHKKWYHAGLYADRTQLTQAHKELREFCSKTSLVLGIRPLQTLAIHTEERVKCDDDVYLAISIERIKQQKRINKKRQEKKATNDEQKPEARKRKKPAKV